MNSNDKKLIAILVSTLIIILTILKLTADKENKIANIYYENEIILTIDLSKQEQEYIVNGYNGDVKISAGGGRIKVISEKSEKHLCSKQGYISESYETIVCLPNKIIIKITSNNDLDATL